MMKSIPTGRLAAGTAAVVLSLALAGCGSGISYEDARELRSQLRDVEARLDGLDGKLAALADRVDSDGQEDIAGLRVEIDRVNETLASVSESLKPPARPEQPTGQTGTGMGTGTGTGAGTSGYGTGGQQ